MSTDSYEKLQRKIIRDKFVRAIVWVVGVLLVLLILPGLVATVWVPSCAVCHNDAAFVKQTNLQAHADIECTTCHGGSKAQDALLFREKVVYQMAIPVLPAAPKDLSFVPDATCDSCHEDAYVETTVSNGIRISHQSCAPQESSSCLDCHSTVAHGTAATIWPSQYDMIACLDCHAEEGVSDEAGCDLCHVGSYDAPAPTAGTAFKNTHGSDWESTHGMGDSKMCGACHPADYCAPCHGGGVPHPVNFAMSHGAIAKDPNNKCATCHKNEKTFCFGCHGMEIPHPDGFLQKHSRIVNTYGVGMCYNCHSKTDCALCHTAHTHPGGAL